MSMTDEEFDAFLATANAELRDKQARLMQIYGLGEMKRWWFEQVTQQLQFFDGKDKLTLLAGVIDIGSYSPKSKTWKWAWGNQSVLPDLRKKALSLRELEAMTGFDMFGKENAFVIDGEGMAWELAAISIRHLDAIGCYRSPSSSVDGPTSYLAIMDLSRSC